MSSLRNAVKRVTHKERGQVQKRSHLGLLEKKVDYKKRSDNYHRKEERIKSMRIRASMKNPDEYYFGMQNNQIIDGKHKKTVDAKQKEFNDTIGHETVRIMKDQDLNYIRTQKQKDIKQIDKLQSSLHFIEEQRQTTTTSTKDVSRKRKHTIFVDSKEEADEFDPAKHFDTAPELVHRTFNRPRIEKLKDDAARMIGHRSTDNNDDENDNENVVFDKEEFDKKNAINRKVSYKLAKARQRSYGELVERKKRVNAMKTAESHLVTEKLLATCKGTRRKVQPAENGRPPIYKWRRKRLG